MSSPGIERPVGTAAGEDLDVRVPANRDAEIPLSKRSRAARLIEQLIGTGQVTPTDLATAIVVSERRLASFRSGRMKVPLERQLCLALFAIERSPVARRAGFALRAQVEAEMAVASTRTETHNEPPVIHRWPT